MKTEMNWDKLEQRKELIDDIAQFLIQTQQIVQAYGTDEISLDGKFDSIGKAIDSSDLSLVFVGDYSRGKSSLINALLDTPVLPTSLQQTTAINTFIYGAAPGETPKIRIAMQDGRQEDHPLDNDVLKYWGTELDGGEKRDVRREVDRINVFTDHPLFQQKIRLIDTPGFNGMLPHHEDVAKQAMDEAHVAVWIQSSGQLGGTASEWELLQTALAKNFNKIITVVNKADELENERKEKGLAQSIYYDQIRKLIVNRFREVGNLDEARVMTMTAPENIHFVSARWALERNAELREQSNIQVLADRIQQMCTSGEAKSEIIAKPLQALLSIQTRQQEIFEREIELLKKNEDAQTRQEDRDKLEFEKRKTELELDNTKSEFTHEHREWARKYASELQAALVEPLKRLKGELEVRVTKAYVQDQIDRGVQPIPLPEDIREEFQLVLESVDQNWVEMKQRVQRTLIDLQADFSESVSKTTKGAMTSLENTGWKLPELKVDLSIDLEGIERYQQQRLALQKKIEKLEEDSSQQELALSLAGHEQETLDAQRIEIKNRLTRAERQLSLLGNQPAPIVRQESRTITGEGMWESDKTVMVDVQDQSNVEQWRQNKAQIETKLFDEESTLKKIQQEEMEKRKQAISIEHARKILKKKMARQEREMKRAEKAFQKAREKMIETSYKRLKQATSAKVETMLKMIETESFQAIETLFQDQMKILIDHVQEQYLDRLETARRQLEDIDKRIAEGEAARTARLEELAQMQSQLDELKCNTQDLLARAQAA